MDIGNRILLATITVINWAIPASSKSAWSVFSHSQKAFESYEQLGQNIACDYEKFFDASRSILKQQLLANGLESAKICLPLPYRGVPAWAVHSNGI